MTVAPDHSPAHPKPWGFLGAFILLDLCAFSLLFLLFMVERSEDPQGFAAMAAHLDLRLGALNTLLLITSGLTMALAVICARRGDNGKTARMLGLTILTGLGFGAVKIAEWVAKASDPIFASSQFGLLYYGLTALHFFHYVVGLGIIVVFLLRLRGQAQMSEVAADLEYGAAYWHMVDLIWLFLFPLLYLIGAAL